ncbi:MAG: diacylglycerol kinase family lipid kinase [Bacteroidales bacterium]|nr:diacylglycerol kinase family lipid kinase [Bacteroidales bacterium]
MKKRWLVIVNPNAGNKKAAKEWNYISSLLVDAGFDFLDVYTKNRLHAIQLTKDYIQQGFTNIIVVGGDGTINEVVNGIFQQKKHPTTEIPLGMISVGTGNDWGRMYGIPSKYDDAIATIKKGDVFVQDAGLVEFYESENKLLRYFVNVSGLGYDALVAKKVNNMKDKGYGGRLTYLLNIFLGLFQYKFHHIKLHVDDLLIKESIFSMSVGICMYNGGGMKQLPNAIPDDGLFDLTVIKKIGKAKILRNIKNLYDGSFIDLPEVLSFRGKTIKIDSTPKIYLESDGESLGHSPITFTIIPKSIKIIRGINLKI